MNLQSHSEHAMMNKDLRPVNSQARHHKFMSGQDHVPNAVQSSASIAQPTNSIVVESINPTASEQEALTLRDRNSKAENEFLDTLDEEIRQTEQSVNEMNARYNHLKH